MYNIREAARCCQKEREVKSKSELEKLQTLPVGYTACLKNKEKRGKGIGNGWTIDVICHILKGVIQ